MTCGAFAAALHRIGVPDAGSILFPRMVFSICIGNTGDHLRNHGLLFDGRWQHAPSFELVSDGQSAQAIGVGTLGRKRCLSNALSDASRFGLSSAEVQRMVDDVRRGLTSAEAAFEDYGFSTTVATRLAARLLP